MQKKQQSEQYETANFGTPQQPDNSTQIVHVVKPSVVVPYENILYKPNTEMCPYCHVGTSTTSKKMGIVAWAYFVCLLIIYFPCIYQAFQNCQDRVYKCNSCGIVFKKVRYECC